MTLILPGADLEKTLPDKTFIDLQARQPLFRAHDEKNHAVKMGVPQWFTLDPNHDYIEMSRPIPGKQVSTLTVNSPIRVINLKNSIIQQLLNIAIDRLTPNELAPYIKHLGTLKNSDKLWENETREKEDTKKGEYLKKRLKAAYGGISFNEQMNLVFPGYLTNRIHKVGNFVAYLQTLMQMSGFRLSQYEYDLTLCNIIVQVFAQKHAFFTGVKGWIHDQWQTPWHDKDKNMTGKFKNEVVLILDNTTTYLSAPSTVPALTFTWSLPSIQPPFRQPGGGKILAKSAHRDEKLKSVSRKKVSKHASK
jgi:hypothetical protein